jgi:hypothetical protein
MAVRGRPWRGSYVPVQNGRLFIGSFISHRINRYP